MQLNFSNMPIAQPKFGGGFRIKSSDFKEGDADVSGEVAEYITNVYSGYHYERMFDISRAAAAGDQFIFNGENANLAEAIKTAQPQIEKLCLKKLNWSKEQVEKAIHKLYQRMCGETPMDWE